jgi:phosphopentomutase
LTTCSRAEDSPNTITRWTTANASTSRSAFAQGLEAFDIRLPELLNQLRADDLLFITADHGNDPTTPSTDHSREHVPLLALGPGFRAGIDLGTRPTFADLGRTAADFLGVKPTRNGTSFLKDIR